MYFLKKEKINVHTSVINNYRNSTKLHFKVCLGFNMINKIFKFNTDIKTSEKFDRQIN